MFHIPVLVKIKMPPLWAEAKFWFTVTGRKRKPFNLLYNAAMQHCICGILTFSKKNQLK